MAELTFSSSKQYADPFNDVDVDVVFEGKSKQWRVPAFWHGASNWTVRFAPPEPGVYRYRLTSNDRSNPTLNDRTGSVAIKSYSGPSDLLKRGAFRVSANGRHFEQADGTPFYWVGDTLYTALSDRLNWDGFQTLVQDRAKKGFTVVELAVMAPSNEETAPLDAGFCNEGGCVWDEQFESINPRYFDYADRRIQYLTDAGIAPAIFGAWRQTMTQMGTDRLAKHWRYIIARFGAYPVFWVAGGEIYDPPADQRLPGLPYGAQIYDLTSRGWTEVLRYIRKVDPYGHPVSVHEIDPPYDTPVQDESLKDFELFQAGHRNWSSIATEIALLNTHYSRTKVAKPLIVGEMGWETIGGAHYEDFQRMAFWVGMLNGAAGYSYGNAITGEAYSIDKPLHRIRHSLMTWEEGMKLPGSYQVGIASKLLRSYRWQDFVPQPEWVRPNGTTLLEPNSQVNGFDIDLVRASMRTPPPKEADLPDGKWKNMNGDFRLPYAAGIPGEVRFVYIPSVQWPRSTNPTILNLEPGVRYRTYYWEPSLGVKFDLGTIAASPRGEVIAREDFSNPKSHWANQSGTISRCKGRLNMSGAALSTISNVEASDIIVSARISTDANAGLVLRYKDPENYLAAVFSPASKAIYIVERRDSRDSAQIAYTKVEHAAASVNLIAEVRGDHAIVSLENGRSSFSSPIVDVQISGSGKVGLLHLDDGTNQAVEDFEVMRPAPAISNSNLDRDLHDAEGRYRGTLAPPGWNEYARQTIVLQKAYRPPRVPFPQDWLLILDREK